MTPLDGGSAREINIMKIYIIGSSVLLGVLYEVRRSTVCGDGVRLSVTHYSGLNLLSSFQEICVKSYTEFHRKQCQYKFNVRGVRFSQRYC